MNNAAYICPATDVDWFKFTSSATNNNLKISLSNLPFDYDLELYNAGGTLLYSSTNSSTTAEQIIYNAAPAATYYVKVYGYNGNFSSTTAYTLRVSTQSAAWSPRATSTTALSGAVAPDAPLVMITNPVAAGEKAWLTVEGYEGPATLLLRDAQGQPVGTTTQAQVHDAAPLGYPIPRGLKPGVYVVAVQLATHVEYLKLLVQ